MESLLTIPILWQIAVIKLLFCFFVGLGILFYFKFKKPLAFVFLISSFSALAYYFLIYGFKTTFWGIVGDEIFITAIFQKFANGHFFSDFFYANLPPFYPPLYFWVVGLISYALGFNGVKATHAGIMLVLFFTPLLAYFIQKYFWLKSQEKIADWKIVLNSALIMVVADQSALILKPYEFISAVFCIFWFVFLIIEIENKTLNKFKIILYGFFGAILFLTYYFWFILLALAFCLYKLFTLTDIKQYFSQLFFVAIVSIIFSLPYILPLGWAYWHLGAENWQPAFFVPDSINFYFPFLQLSVFGLVAVGGLISLIYFRSKIYIKALGILFFAAWLWFLINLVVIILNQPAIVPEKSFVIFSGAILSLAAAFGLGEIFDLKVKNENLKTSIFIFAWIILGTQMIFGNFIDNPKVRTRMIELKKYPSAEVQSIVENLMKVKNLDQLTILSSNVPQISAYQSLNYYISYNIHFSHPAANFSQRYYYLVNLAQSQNANDFYQSLSQAPLEKINALLLYKDVDSYPLLFWLDNYPNGGREEMIKIPKNLIDENLYNKVFENKDFIFLTTK